MINDAKSLDDLDRESFHAGRAPFDGAPIALALSAGKAEFHELEPRVLDLSGEWKLADGGDEEARLRGEWPDAIPCHVPGSVHTALREAGKLPDPAFGKNQLLAARESYKAWWYERSFALDDVPKAARLRFDGIANRCAVWLNGTRLGLHEGMFGGPNFDDVEKYLRAENRLIVKLEPIPEVFEGNHGTENTSWKNTVVFNNVYGWHYSQLPSLGIWRKVELEYRPAVRFDFPFISTFEAKSGIMNLSIPLESNEGCACDISGHISLKGSGEPGYNFRLIADTGLSSHHFRFSIPDPQLWYPVDLGSQPIYELEMELSQGGLVLDRYKTDFAIRTVTMRPLPAGKRPDKYDWTFVINGEPRFIKGTGWCTMDPCMDFSIARYEWLVSLARDQHVQMFRGWGSGMPETDEFFKLCDEAGILVIQEWPTAWDSHTTQPYGMLEETVRLNTLRLRNHPSIVMWGAGNESPNPFGPAIDMMGRLAIELDGTRPFHRGEPWGGSKHDYSCYWGRQPIDYNMTMIADFHGEFGIASSPVYESLLRYLPEAEQEAWPPAEDSVFSYHLPIFNQADCLSRQRQYSGYFLPESDATLRHYAVASQLAQAMAVRHPLERSRIRWPDCSGALYYKMNDNFPAVSWACVDWYGAPKLSHYIFQDAFAPLHACIVFDRTNYFGSPVDARVYLLDDADALKGLDWIVRVKAFGGDLNEIGRKEFHGRSSIASPCNLTSEATGWPMPIGTGFHLSYEAALTAPLFVVAEVLVDGVLADSTFYWLNFEAKRGSMFSLPMTELELSVAGLDVTVRNIGDSPAVGANVSMKGNASTFKASDNFFWLDRGESRTVRVNKVGTLSASAMNCGFPD
jgi:beta-mannosidase